MDMLAQIKTGYGKSYQGVSVHDDTGRVRVLSDGTVSVWSWIQPDIGVRMPAEAIERLIQPDSDEGLRIRAAGCENSTMPTGKNKYQAPDVIVGMIERAIVYGRATTDELRAMLGYSSAAAEASRQAWKKYVDQAEVQRHVAAVKAMPHPADLRQPG